MDELFMLKMYSTDFTFIFLCLFLKIVNVFQICSVHEMLCANTVYSKSCLYNCKLFEIPFTSVRVPWSSNYIALFLLSYQVSKKFIGIKEVNYNQLLSGACLVFLYLKQRSQNMNKENILKNYCRMNKLCQANITFFS